MSKVTLSRLTPTAAATRVPARPHPAAPTPGPRPRIGAELPRYAHDVLGAARAASGGGYAWGRRALATLADAGRATADVDRLAEVGSPVRSAPFLVAVPSLTMTSEDRRPATPADHRPPSTRDRGERARAAEILSLSGRSITDVLIYGALVGVVFALAAYALMLARLRLLAAREAGTRVWSPRTAFGTTLASRPEVGQFISAANGADVRPAREVSNGDASGRPRAAHLAAVPAPTPPTPPTPPAAAAETRPPRRRRRGPWQPEEITAGLLLGWRMADERNTVLSQRVLRTLAQEDPRIPSWSVVDRAARRAGQTGGGWLHEARLRHEAGILQAVPAYGAETGLRASA